MELSKAVGRMKPWQRSPSNPESVQKLCGCNDEAGKMLACCKLRRSVAAAAYDGEILQRSDLHTHVDQKAITLSRSGRSVVIGFKRAVAVCFWFHDMKFT
uniref:Uncharacterized protein n=1 Tax=Physcomitrium patens TaxID=3218 RepID=A0A2K1L206_PHYPA|nr:hypothetical protein PHYPA_002860 [Physcomitrium patens]